jgi:hypothetical protein
METIPKSPKFNPQRNMSNPQPGLFEDQEEELDNKIRRFLRRLKQSRDRYFARMESPPDREAK